MFLTYANLFQALVLAGGLWWCKEVWDRCQDDYRDLRQSPDATRRWVVILIWGVTAVIVILMARFAWNLAAALYHAFF